MSGTGPNGLHFRSITNFNTRNSCKSSAKKIKNIKNMAENEDNIVDVIIEPDPTDPTEELKKGLKSNHFLVIKDSLENGADLRIV